MIISSKILKVHNENSYYVLSKFYIDTVHLNIKHVGVVQLQVILYAILLYFMLFKPLFEISVFTVFK